MVDTHILLWSFLETDKLSKKIKSILLDENIGLYKKEGLRIVY